VQLTGILITIILSGWFAGAETVFLCFNKLYLPAWLRRKEKGAESVDFMIKRPERFLVTTLVGNNIVNVAYSSIIALYLASYGFSEQSIVIIAPLILLILGEAVPKTIARQVASKIILPVGRILFLFRYLIIPIARPLEGLIVTFQQRLGLSETEMGQVLSRAEITAAIEEAGKKGDLPVASKPLIRGLLNIGEKNVSDIMTPRTSVLGLSINTPVEEALEIILKSGFSTFPCFERDLDDVVGFVSANSFLVAVPDLKSVMKPLPSVPESVSVIGLLSWFRRNRTGFAGVIDEYGGFAGVVTREDLIEEMIGPVQDEHDFHDLGMWQITERVWLIDGQTKLSQVSLLTGFELQSQHATSVGGFLTRIEGDIPGTGKLFNVNGGTFRVMQADPRGVKLVRLTLKNVKTGLTAT